MTIWGAVDQLIDRAAGWADLRAHRLHLLAARRYRARGLPVPDDVAQDEALARVVAVSTPLALERVRDAAGAPVVILKGPEVAARYPEPALRAFVDLDLLVGDPDSVQAALLAAGFEEADDPPWAFRLDGRDLFADRHHARPLFWPGLPIRLEIHRHPSWPRWLDPPSPEPLLARAVPSATNVEGVLTLSPIDHALVIAAHTWVHEPLARVRDLVDLAVMSEGLDRTELAGAADLLGIERLWNATIACADALVSATRRPTAAQRIWARNLDAVRERTVLEAHLENWISCLWTLPPSRALPLVVRNVVWDLRPAAEEPWRAKLHRTARALRHAFTGKSRHDEELGLEARQLHPSRRWARRRRGRYSR